MKTVIAIVILLVITVDFGMRIFAYAETGDPAYKHEHFVWWR